MLIDADDAGARSADVARECLDHLEADAKALQPGRGGTPEIVYPPRRQWAAIDFRRRGIERRLAFDQPETGSCHS